MPKIGETTSVKRYYLGIDPGASGGLAVIEVEEGSSVIKVVAAPMPPTEADIWDWISQNISWWLRGGKNSCFAVIEKVGGYVGGAGQPGSAMFKFGQNYGSLRMALIASGIPFQEVTPQAWQKEVGMGGKKKGEEKGAWKNRIKAKAQQLFPVLTAGSVTLKTADALLIAMYCRQKFGG